MVRQEKDFFGGRCECGKESKDQQQTAHLPGDFAGSVARCSVAWNLFISEIISDVRTCGDLCGDRSWCIICDRMPCPKYGTDPVVGL